ncbi:MAG: mechanosensitive ion channel, partial [Amphiplicatus sp.]
MRLLLLLALAFLALAPRVHAQSPRESDIAATTQGLQEIHQAIADDRLDDVEALEERLRDLRDGSRRRLDPVRRDISRAEIDRAALGPAPGESDPPESETLAQRRADANALVAELRSQEIQISANISEATELLAQLSTRRVGALYKRTLERGASLFSAKLWRQGLASAGNVSSKIGAYFGNWNDARQRSGGVLVPLLFIVAAFGVSLLMFGPVNRWITASFTARIERYRPTPDRRVVAAGLKMIARAVPGIIGGLILFLTLGAVDVITPEGREVARVAWSVLVAFLLVSGFIAGLFASNDPKWRVAPLMEAQGREAGLYLTAIVAIFGVKTVLRAIGEATEAAPAVMRLLDGASAVAIGVLLLLLCQKRLWTAAAAATEANAAAEPAKENGAAEGAKFWPTARRAARIVALLIIAAPFFGYIDLADFLTSRFYALALILALAWFTRALLREIANWAEHRFRPSQAAKAEDGTKSFEGFWINAAIDTVFAIALLPALLVLVGFSWNAVSDLFLQAFFGFRIGGFQVPSLASVLLAVLTFLIVMGLTRMTQRGLARGPFAHSRLDVGVQNSLTTLLGYAGLIVAMLVAITALGFKLGNLAIIAGALSVGIGFGLQSIVNNFVSGLILLFERPIKVGDW